jgi:hypothetical protein
MIGLQALELLIEQAIEIVTHLNAVDAHLGRQVHPFPVAVAQRAAHERLAAPAMIGIARVDVVDAVVDGPAHHRPGLLLADGAVRFAGQAHAPKAQRRHLVAQTTELTELHRSSSNLSCFMPMAPLPWQGTTPAPTCWSIHEGSASA